MRHAGGVSPVRHEVSVHGLLRLEAQNTSNLVQSVPRNAARRSRPLGQSKHPERTVPSSRRNASNRAGNGAAPPCWNDPQETPHTPREKVAVVTPEQLI